MVRRARTRRWVGLSLVAAMSACSAPPDDAPLDRTGEPLTAYCQANVKGIGLVDTETDYLPHVVHCENGGAPYESLKAQAISARTYLYYKMETAGSIADGTGDQVYSCGSGPTAEQIKAVKDTAGQVLQYKGTTLCAFFVAGGAASPPACIGSSSASTETYVTYNDGKSGAAVTQTTLGWVSPTNYRNRGCLSQLGSRCLANLGKTADEIVHFYYGADVDLITATGSCVTPTPDAGPDTSIVDTGFIEAGADTGSKDTGAADVGAVDAPRPDSAMEAGDTGISDTKPDAADARPSSAEANLDLRGSCSCGQAGRSAGGQGGAAIVVLGAALLARRRRPHAGKA